MTDDSSIFTSIIQEDGSLPVRGYSDVYAHPVLISRPTETALWPSLTLRSDITDSQAETLCEGDPLIYSEEEVPVRIFYVDTNIDYNTVQTGSKEQPFSSLQKILHNETIECLCSASCCSATKVVVKIRGPINDVIIGNCQNTSTCVNFNGNLLLEPWDTEKVVVNYKSKSYVCRLISSIHGVVFRNFEVNLAAEKGGSYSCFENVHSCFFVNCTINFEFRDASGSSDILFVDAFSDCDQCRFVKTVVLLKDIDSRLHLFSYAFIRAYSSSCLAYDCTFEFFVNNTKGKPLEHMSNVWFDNCNSALLAASHINIIVNCHLGSMGLFEGYLETPPTLNLNGFAASFAYDINVQTTLNVIDWEIDATIVAVAIYDNDRYSKSQAYGDTISINTEISADSGSDELSNTLEYIGIWSEDGFLKNVDVRLNADKISNAATLHVEGIHAVQKIINSIVQNCDIYLNLNNIYPTTYFGWLNRNYIYGIANINEYPEIMDVIIKINANIIVTKEKNRSDLRIYGLYGNFATVAGGPIANLTATASVNLNTSAVDTDDIYAFVYYCWTNLDLSDICYNVTHDNSICIELPDSGYCKSFKCF